MSRKAEQEIKEIYDRIYLSEEEKDELYEQIILRKRGNFHMSKIMKAAVIAVCLLAVGSSAYAAIHLLQPSEVVKELGDAKLAKNFEKLSSHVVTKEAKGYRFSYLGEVSGKNLSDYLMESDGEHTHYVFAIEKIGEKAITRNNLDPDINVSPFIKGMKPADEIYTLSFGYDDIVIDGVKYMLFDAYDLEAFADKGVYLAVHDSGIASGEEYEKAYSYDEKTGEISSRKDYQGINLLFDMNLDPAKADPEKAEAILKEWQESLRYQHAYEEPETGDIDDWGWCYGDLNASTRFGKKFTKLSKREREQYLKEHGTLIPDSVQTLKPDKDYYYSYEWKRGNRQGSADAWEVNAINVREHYKVGEEVMESFLPVLPYFPLMTVELNADGTMTFRAYKLEESFLMEE